LDLIVSLGERHPSSYSYLVLRVVVRFDPTLEGAKTLSMNGSKNDDTRYRVSWLPVQIEILSQVSDLVKPTRVEHFYNLSRHCPKQGLSLDSGLS
jgi:hypothetical protein